jgi:hypothetical protein
MKEFAVIDAIRNERGEMIGVVLEGGKKLMISEWEHQTLASFKNVFFKVPQKGPFSKFIEKAISLKRTGEILQLQSYWRFGIVIEKSILTRSFKFVGDKHDEFLTRSRMPFGHETIGDIDICLAENKKTGEKRLIINYLLSLSTSKKAKHLIKIGGKKTAKTIGEFEIPGTSEKILINQI